MSKIVRITPFIGILSVSGINSLITVMIYYDINVLLNVLVAAIVGIGQYGIQKNIYMHPRLALNKRLRAGRRVRETGLSSGPSASYR